MKSGSAKHNAEERPSKASTSKKVFLNAKGSILIRTIVDMVIISSGYANLTVSPSTRDTCKPHNWARHHRVAQRKGCLTGARNRK
jgi:hypothetical protein